MNVRAEVSRFNSVHEYDNLFTPAGIQKHRSRRQKLFALDIIASDNSLFATSRRAFLRDVTAPSFGHFLGLNTQSRTTDTLNTHHHEDAITAAPDTRVRDRTPPWPSFPCLGGSIPPPRPPRTVPCLPHRRAPVGRSDKGRIGSLLKRLARLSNDNQRTKGIRSWASSMRGAETWHPA